MERDIVTKLRAHLQQPSDTECKVVYLLCQLRKLGSGKKLPFSLQMCFNWALHVELDRNSGADDLLSKIDDAVGNYLATKSVDAFLTPLHAELLFIGDFQSDLKAYLGQQGLPTDLCDDPEQWRSFIREFSGVIEDGCIKPTSTKAKPSTLKYVEKVCFSKKPVGSLTLQARLHMPFLMNWLIHLKPGVGKQTLELSVVESKIGPTLSLRY